jgi:hypothetical protein
MALPTWAEELRCDNVGAQRAGGIVLARRPCGALTRGFPGAAYALVGPGVPAANPLVKNGGRTRARTWDPLIKSQLLYQLSYASIPLGTAAI